MFWYDDGMHRRMWLRCTHLSKLKPFGLPHLPHPLAPQLARVGQWFHAMSDTTRLSILELLSQRDRSAGELYEILFVPRSRISFHLKVLTEAGLISRHRFGRCRAYSLHGETICNMIEFARTVLPGAHVGTCPWTHCQAS
jgi:ArsR family transcriptional regulator, arsenate/arsenite/antimonite-responsive transcriptional repressor